MNEHIVAQGKGEPPKEAKPESAIERRHNQMLAGLAGIRTDLNGEVTNAVYAAKREQLELDRNHHVVVMDRLNDILQEEQRFHAQWESVQARLTRTSERHASLYAATNVLRLIVNASILIVLVMYLMDMG